jgi:hypothetical protein
LPRRIAAASGDTNHPRTRDAGSWPAFSFVKTLDNKTCGGILRATKVAATDEGMKMETKWTPGPWSVMHSSWETSFVYADGGWHIATVDISDLVDEDSQANFERIKDANAHLIAAAPELYEALALVLEDGE